MIQCVSDTNPFDDEPDSVEIAEKFAKVCKNMVKDFKAGDCTLNDIFVVLEDSGRAFEFLADWIEENI